MRLVGRALVILRSFYRYLGYLCDRHYFSASKEKARHSQKPKFNPSIPTSVTYYLSNAGQALRSL